MPRKISIKEASSATPLITKRFNPTGGVINANSMFIVMITANHTGSIPMASKIGKMMGSVMMVIETTSKKSPRKMKMMHTKTINCQGDTFSSLRKVIKRWGTWRIVTTWPKRIAPIMISRTIAVVRRLESSTGIKSKTLSRRDTIAATRL